MTMPDRADAIERTDNDRVAKALRLAQQIDARAEKLANDMAFEIRLACRGAPDFMAIMLRAVERKIGVLAHDAESRAGQQREARDGE